MATAVRAVRKGLQGVSEHYRKLEELRLRQREDLEARLRELRESSTPAETVDVNDVEALSDNASNAGVGAAVVEITARTLQGIESALRRLRDGKYGVCADCGGEISAARLRAMPFAERCRDCQELADTEGVVLAG
ncbi:MAG TPA: TraR/DksA family transcriptional regulator [Vicinamibacteria bacterium]|nr:TraR/DksA family transcriptional regulator [Vicinamibacteria bacterium]